jgi:CheY-like chemotaxis protein
MREDRPILLVEDDEDDVLLMQRALRKANVGAPVHVAGDGDEAVAYLARAGRYAERAQWPLPGLVLLDLKLPRRSGLEVLDWLRGQEGLRRIPVVVLTSSREVPDVNRAYDLGANSYLVKPSAPADLVDLVGSVAGYWLRWNEAPHVPVARGANGGREA